jgi:NADH-quinone oxidoreductase subunit L
MTVYNMAWAVVLLPLGAALASYVVESPRRAAWVCVGGMALAFGVAIVVLGYRLGHISQAPYSTTITLWTYQAGPQPNGEITTFNPQMGVLVDGLSAAVMPTVAFVTLAVQVYSLQYLRNDAGLRRFFVVTAIFGGAMLGLVASPNLFQSLFLWITLTVGSALLVGHWWHRPAAGAAALRLALTVGVGDVALLLATVFGFTKLAPDVGLLPPAPGLSFNDPFDFSLLAVEWQRVANHAVSGSGLRTLEVMAILVFVAALAKAAQLPFTGWLAGMAEAPAPALALLCAAGPLTAGVYLLARMYRLFELAPHVLTAIAVVGAITAVVGAVAALAHNDIKRLLAFMSVAQVGLMLVALGVGAFSAAIFQLLTQAWFMALLCLAAGNLVSAYGTQDIRQLGGAARRMPATARLLLAGCLSAGLVPLFAGFWSADSIVAGIIRNSSPDLVHVAPAAQAVVLLLTCVAILVLAGAALRLYAAVALGEPARRRGFVPERVRESPRLMLVPMLGLAVLAVFGGLIGIEGAPRTFAKFVHVGAGAPSYGFSAAGLLITAGLTLAGASAAVLLASGRLEWLRQALTPLSGVGRLAADALHLERASERLVTWGVAHVAPVPGRVDDAVVEVAAGDVAAATELLGAGLVQGQPRRLPGQLLAAAAAMLLVVGAVTLAATGHFPGVGAAR